MTSRILSAAWCVWWKTSLTGWSLRYSLSSLHHVLSCPVLSPSFPTVKRTLKYPWQDITATLGHFNSPTLRYLDTWTLRYLDIWTLKRPGSRDWRSSSLDTIPQCDPGLLYPSLRPVSLSMSLPHGLCCHQTGEILITTLRLKHRSSQQSQGSQWM